MSTRFVPPRGALIMMVLGIVMAVAALYLPRSFAYGVETSVLGAAIALAGVLWHVVARFRWRWNAARK